MLGSTYHINSRAHVLLEEHRNTAKTTWGYKLGHSCALFEKKSTTVLRAWKGKATHIERNWKWATPTDKFTMEAEKRILINRKGKLSMANTATAENVQSQNQNECVIPGDWNPKLAKIWELLFCYRNTECYELFCFCSQAWLFTATSSLPCVLLMPFVLLI